MESTLNNVMYHVRILYPKKEWSEGANTPRDHRLFNTCFNMTLEQISLLVMKIRWVWGENIKRMWNVKYLLWTLSYLKRYPTYDQLECELGHDKNNRKVDYVYCTSYCRNWHGEWCGEKKLSHSISSRLTSRTDSRAVLLRKMYL